jgi:SAM-dependent methyltransferase
MTTDTIHGSAAKWGPLWGARPVDWGLNEERQRPTYADALDHLGPVVGKRVLDIGCGTGVFLEEAAARGAEPYGLDASEALLAIARERVPGAELRAGDMEAMPYADDSFDVVTGFNAFFFAADLVAALREAGRVAKPGAPVVIGVWGPPERNDLEAMKRIARAYAPPPPPDAPTPPSLSTPGVLEELAAAAGLTPRAAFDTAYPFEYADDEELGRLLVAPMGLAALAGPEREGELRREIVAALAAHRLADGGYRLDNEFHTLITCAR